MLTIDDSIVREAARAAQEQAARDAMMRPFLERARVLRAEVARLQQVRETLKSMLRSKLM